MRINNTTNKQRRKRTASTTTAPPASIMDAASTARKPSLKDKLAVGVSKASRYLAYQMARRKTKVPPQSESPLVSRLPLELREMIWSFTLSSPHPAHFHVYDTAVYDTCTYDPRIKHPRAKRLEQISLLLTCRKIYEEALHFLYKDQHFTVVLCAGLARPKHLIGRKAMGQPADCKTVFARMRRTELVVQPGHRTEMTKFLAHIESFLAIIEHGRHLKDLVLRFNFNMRADDELRASVLRKFHALGDFYHSQEANGIHPPSITLSIPNPPLTQDNPYTTTLADLASILAPPTQPLCPIDLWTLPRPTGNRTTDFPGGTADDRPCDFGPICLRRGAWGRYDRMCRRTGLVPPLVMTKRHYVAVLVVLPVVLPIMVGSEVYRRFVKGH